MAKRFGSPSGMFRYDDSDDETENNISPGVSKEAEHNQDEHDERLLLKSENRRLHAENESLRSRVEELEEQLAAMTGKERDKDVNVFDNRTPPRGHSSCSTRMSTTPPASPNQRDTDVNVFDNRTPPRGHSSRSTRMSTTPPASPNQRDTDVNVFDNPTPPRGHSPLSKRMKTITASPKQWTPFTGEEEENIVEYLKRPEIRAVGIKSGTWEKMKDNVFQKSRHPASSLENRFRKKILPKLESFFDTPEETKNFLRKVMSPSKELKN